MSEQDPRIAAMYQCANEADRKGRLPTPRELLTAADAAIDHSTIDSALAQLRVQLAERNQLLDRARMDRAHLGDNLTETRAELRRVENNYDHLADAIARVRKLCDHPHMLNSRDVLAALNDVTETGHPAVRKIRDEMARMDVNYTRMQRATDRVRTLATSRLTVDSPAIFAALHIDDDRPMTDAAYNWGRELWAKARAEQAGSVVTMSGRRLSEGEITDRATEPWTQWPAPVEPAMTEQAAVDAFVSAIYPPTPPGV